MSTFLWTVVSKISLALLSLRYRVEVRGQELLTSEHLNRKKGILFLPNHPALIDPLLLYLILWPRFRMRPLVIEYIYRTPLLRPLMKLVRAVPMPNFDTSINELKIQKAEKALRQIVDGLNRRENFIFYPSGKLKSTGKETLGAVSGVHALLEECPEANVVLVRTTGLWGSRFSRAIEGRSPDLQKTLLYSLKALFRNFIFLLPRRRVLIEIEPNPPLPRGERLELNKALENWYNRYPDERGYQIAESEPLTLISYSRWRREVPHLNAKKRKERDKTVPISDPMREKIYGEIRRVLEKPDLEIEEEMYLATDLGIDSLGIAELVAIVSKTYNVRDLHPEDLDTVEHVLQLAAGSHPREHLDRRASIFHWPADAKKRLNPSLPIGLTIPEAFLRSCQRMGKAMACADDLVGPLSYQKLKRAALVLASVFRKWEEKKIAVLLPASVGAYLVILGLQLAGKVPVMLNWTLGPRYLDEMMRLSGAKKVISSWRFLDRLSHVDLGGCADKVMFLEDIRGKLTLGEKLHGVFLSYMSISYVLRSLKLSRIDPTSPAVILFTSGTEASPKGVPLSHQNILANERSGMQCIEVEKNDILYGILPPFHSFGFSVAGIFPILAGIAVAFYPDPTDSFALAEGIERWKITMFCSAPSFLRSLLHVAEPKQLKTVRFFVVGAEKTPPELFEKVKQLKTGARVLEGYGITECSPIISLNSPNLPPKGVGRILPDIELVTIHPETLEMLQTGEEGEICVRGPNVFSGYLDHPRSPFIELEGKKWYRTGDLGYLDPEGNLLLSGRLKRFVKVGGEMISLGAIEEALLKDFSSSEEGPTLAVCPVEKEGGQPQLIVFTTRSLSTEEANEILRKTGFSRLVKIGDVRHVDAIPLMGAGKIDYRTLYETL